MTAILLAVSKYGRYHSLGFFAKHFAMKRGYKYREKLKFYRLLVCRLWSVGFYNKIDDNTNEP